jgi:hypothetical protein
MPINREAVKLGKGPAKLDPRRLKLAHYAISLPDPPDEIDFSDRWVGPWGMLDNDRLGDCTIAAVGHTTQCLGLYLPSDEVVDDYYGRWCGYVEGDPSTDRGGIEVDVLDKWRKEGFNGHKLVAYADPAISNVKLVKQSIATLGNCYIGVALPITAADQEVWDVVPGGGYDTQPGSWGLHAVAVVRYDALGPWCITWGKLQHMTWAWWLKYVDEAHTLFVEDFIEEHGPAPGMDMALLMQDLQLITG